jgi:chromosome partitioning protein
VYIGSPLPIYKPMKIIALLNEKGGSGKTTVAINLGAALHRRGIKVIIVDADPQGTARDWRAASPDNANLPPVVALDRPQMLKSLDSLNADVVIIDTPAKAEATSAMAIRMAHIALVVIQPSNADIWACAATIKMIQTKLDLGGKLDVAFLTNRTNKRTKLTKETVKGEWNTYKLEQLSASLANRTVYAEALSEGKSVYDFKNADAVAEIDALVAELEAARWL